MMIYGFLLPGWSDLVLTVAFSFHFLAVCGAVSIPWMAAHLEFWGGSKGCQGYRPAATRLGQIAVYNLGAVFMFGILSYLLASIRAPEKLFAASVLMAPGLGLFLIFLMGYVGLIYLYSYGWKWGMKFRRIHIWTALAAGVMAVFCVAFLVALIIGVMDDSLWPRLRADAWSIFGEVNFWFAWVFSFLSVFMTGGIVTMLIGRDAFRWESGASVPDGARLIRLGAFFSLYAIFMMVLLAGAWILLRGLEPLRAIIFSDRPELLALAIIAIIGIVALVEILMSVLKWHGSAPRASVFAAVFLFLAVFGLTSIISWKQVSNQPDGGKSAVYSQGKS